MMAYNWLNVYSAPPIIAYSLSFIALLIGSITDLKTREVPDWLNYGLIISGISLNMLFSAIYSDSSFAINSIVGLLILFGIAYIMFYAGQWGGGDSKMLMGLGAMIGVDVGFEAPQFLAGFFINALFAGAIYVLSWSIFLAIKNKGKFVNEIRKILSIKKIILIKKITIFIVALGIIFSLLAPLFFVKLLMLSFALIIALTFYLWVFVKAIEKSAMYKLVEPSRLTEGDWIVKDIYVNNQYICGPKDLGIEKKQIKKLIEFYRKGKVKKILIKEGIPFVPSFFIAFVVTFVIGNPMMFLL